MVKDENSPYNSVSVIVGVCNLYERNDSSIPSFTNRACACKLPVYVKLTMC